MYWSLDYQTRLAVLAFVPNRSVKQITAVDCSIIRFDRAVFLPELFVALTKSSQYFKNIEGYLTGATRPRISRSNLGKVRIPLPPLPVQQEIVAEIEGYQKVIDGARAVVDNYRPHISVNPDWPLVALGQISRFIRGITFRKSDQLERATEDSLPVATTKAAQETGIVEEALYHIPRSLLKDDDKLLKPGDILISTANSLGLLGRTTHIEDINRSMSFGAFMSVIRPDSSVQDTYLVHCLRSKRAADFFLRYANTTTNISNLNLNSLAKFQIPLPPMQIQKEIAFEIEIEQSLVNANRALIARFEKKIQGVIDRVWGASSSG